MSVTRDAAAAVRRVAVLGTLDTKGDEVAYVASCISTLGCEPWLIDLSLAGTPSPLADTSRAEIAAAAGQEWETVSALPRAAAMEVMAAGAASLLEAMVAADSVHAVIGIGGGTGTWMATTALHGLPIGFPKLVVSTIAKGDGHRDIAILPSIVDIAGLNSILMPILANAAAAACGMAAARGAVATQSDRPTIALTMFGVTTEGGTHVRRFLEEAGCEVVVFHATGAGGATMEELAGQGMFAGVLDWTTSEITDELVGGLCTAGPTRLDVPGQLGIPHLIVPGAIDVINVLAPIPERFVGRTHHMHLPTVPLIRTSAEESTEIGGWIAAKLNRATGPVQVLIPSGGFSSLDVDGGPFWDPDADTAFETALREQLRDGIRVDVVPANINDQVFARAAADAMLAMVAGVPANATRSDLTAN